MPSSSVLNSVRTHFRNRPCRETWLSATRFRARFEIYICIIAHFSNLVSSLRARWDRVTARVTGRSRCGC